MAKRKNNLPSPWNDGADHQYQLGDVVLLDGWQRVLIVAWENQDRTLLAVVNRGGAYERRVVPIERIGETTTPTVPRVYYAKRGKRRSDTGTNP